MRRLMVVVLITALGAESSAQSGLTRALNNAKNQIDKVDSKIGEYIFTEAEEAQLGADISEMLRAKYGVVQDREVHRYVTLVGSILAQSSTRPALKWQFIVLDTDGINAFAAPGGFIHITRGALALIQNEAELATVLGHEIGHVTAKHTLNAIQKAKLADAGAKATRREFLTEVANAAYDLILENSFDRGDESASDRIGLELANKAGYAPVGLSDFLTRLADRYQDAKERSGVFASHPETKARVDAINAVITASRLTAAAKVAPRYDQAINFTLVAVADVAQGPPPTPRAKSSASSGGKIGIGNLTQIGRERSGSQTTASAGSRGVNTDRDAKGGPNRNAVNVTVTPAEIAAFKQGIS
jgi:predicted Zn-dependent protease